jgi:hypothetical protein
MHFRERSMNSLMRWVGRLTALLLLAAQPVRADPICSLSDPNPSERKFCCQCAAKQGEGCPLKDSPDFRQYCSGKPPPEPETDTCDVKDPAAQVKLILSNSGPGSSRSAPRNLNQSSQWLGTSIPPYMKRRTGMTAHVDGSDPNNPGLKNEPFAYVRLAPNVYQSTWRRGKSSQAGKLTCLSIASVTLRYHPLMIFVAKEYGPGNLTGPELEKRTCVLNAVTNHELIHHAFITNLDLRFLEHARSELNAYDWPPPARPMAFPSQAQAAAALRDFEGRPKVWLEQQQPAYERELNAHLNQVDTPAEYERVFKLCGPDAWPALGPE